jgi:hypothetical protein
VGVASSSSKTQAVNNNSFHQRPHSHKLAPATFVPYRIAPDPFMRPSRMVC